MSEASKNIDNIQMNDYEFPQYLKCKGSVILNDSSNLGICRKMYTHYFDHNYNSNNSH